MDYRLEQQIRLDLEMALAQVRATVKAGCRLSLLEVDELQFTIRIVVGENYGSKCWRHLTDWGLTVEVNAFELAIKTDLEMYLRDNQRLIEQAWNQMVVQIVNRFFHENQGYQRAIGA